MQVLSVQFPRTISQNQKVDSHQKRWQERPAAHAVDDAKAVRVDAAEVRAGAIDRHVAQENVLDLSDRRQRDDDAGEIKRHPVKTGHRVDVCQGRFGAGPSVHCVRFGVAYGRDSAEPGSATCHA